MTVTDISSRPVLGLSGRSSAARSAPRAHASDRRLRLMQRPLNGARRRVVILTTAAVLAQGAMRAQPLLKPELPITRRRSVL
jgi:hypothetical protein